MRPSFKIRNLPGFSPPADSPQLYFENRVPLFGEAPFLFQTKSSAEKSMNAMTLARAGWNDVKFEELFLYLAEKKNAPPQTCGGKIPTSPQNQKPHKLAAFYVSDAGFFRLMSLYFESCAAVSRIYLQPILNTKNKACCSRRWC